MNNYPEDSKKRNVKNRKTNELQLMFPELMETTDPRDECIVDFIRMSPKYIFPYRIITQFDTPGDAA